MAASPWRIVTGVLIFALTAWVWILSLVLFNIRWNSIQRPGPPIRELFPYGEMRIGVDASYPPFAVATRNDLFGLDIDLGRALGEKLGIPVRFVNMGFDGLYDSIRADQVDMVISALLIDPAKSGEVRYTRHYYNAGLVLVSAGSTPILTMEEIDGHSLAFEFGSHAHAEINLWARRIGDFALRPYELPVYALDAVRLGQADAALVDATTYYLYQQQYPEWRSAFDYVTTAWYAIAVRQNRYETWQAVNWALNALDEEGNLQKIIERWLG